MARRRQVEVVGGLYHVMARGNERKAIFYDDRDRKRYLERIALYRERFGLLAYCLMDNHVHLAIETGNTPLSRIMLALQFSYTQAFNRRYGRVGATSSRAATRPSSSRRIGTGSPFSATFTRIRRRPGWRKGPSDMLGRAIVSTD